MVTATASTAESGTPAWSSALSTTGPIARRCARLASSGTTPPNTWCTSCDRITRLASSGFLSPTSTAAEVSSHEVSIPSTTSATIPPLYHRRVRRGAGIYARRSDHIQLHRFGASGAFRQCGYFDAVAGKPNQARHRAPNRDDHGGRFTRPSSPLAANRYRDAHQHPFGYRTNQGRDLDIGAGDANRAHS